MLRHRHPLIEALLEFTADLDKIRKQSSPRPYWTVRGSTGREID